MEYDYDAVRGRLSAKVLEGRAPGVWKYSELLPCVKGPVVSLGEGGTFLHDCKRLAEELGAKKLFVKDETTNPTGSFVDRGMTVAVSMAKAEGYLGVACGPAGNLAASLAAYSAKAGLGCTAHVTRVIDLGKLYQVIAYGADVKYVKENENNAPFANNGLTIDPVDPFLLQGLKTTGYELVEQMGWRTHARVVIPMGNGTHISMVWRGINELKMIGLIDGDLPIMDGVQVSGASPIVDAFRDCSNQRHPPTPKEVPMDINIKEPLMKDLAVRSIKESNGNAVVVSEKEIIEAMRALAKKEGIFAEPAAASTIAAMKKLLEEGSIDRGDEVVCVITGTGLKDPMVARKMVKQLKNLESMVRQKEERGLTTELGLTKLKILSIIAKGSSSYGYSIWKQLTLNDNLRIQLPSLYQHLSELEALHLIQREGVAKKEGRADRSYYSITARGKQVLSKIKELAS